MPAAEDLVRLVFIQAPLQREGDILDLGEEHRQAYLHRVHIIGADLRLEELHLQQRPDTVVLDEVDSTIEPLLEVDVVLQNIPEEVQWQEVHVTG